MEASWLRNILGLVPARLKSRVHSVEQLSEEMRDGLPLQCEESHRCAPPATPQNTESSVLIRHIKGSLFYLGPMISVEGRDEPKP